MARWRRGAAWRSPEWEEEYRSHKAVFIHRLLTNGASPARVAMERRMVRRTMRERMEHEWKLCPCPQCVSDRREFESR